MPSPAKTEEAKQVRSAPVTGGRTRFMLLFEGVLFTGGLVTAATVTVSRYSGSLSLVVRETVSVWVLLTAFAAATAALLLLIRSARGTRIFGALFAFSLFAGIGTVVNGTFGAGAAAIVVSVAILLYYMDPSVLIFDTIVVFGIAGIASVVGPSFTPPALSAAILALAAYDFVAVYVTRHMIRMAKALLRRKVFFAMIVPVRPDALLTRLSQVSAGPYVYLGTGDLILPALLVSSVAARAGAAASTPVIVGTLIGLGVMHVIFLSRGQRPIPALPPIGVGAVMGYITLFLI